MTQQNRLHMGKSSTTDVLSFPQIHASPKTRQGCTFNGHFLGDVLISLDQAKRQALALRIALRDEILFLTIHSILHLIGYDHAEIHDRYTMQKMESFIWRKIQGIKSQS